ncbi:MAG: aminoacyl-tRNA hydrolase [Candidatus Latescibacteria bacterium]|nr:aminoacyl-tRNA hydrolase [Candidatus Latescibacterota bacterium]
MGNGRVRLIVGLGNPGEVYRHTRHNLGFVVADLLVEQRGYTPWKHDPALLCEFTRVDLGGEGRVIIKPLTFMNRSGVCVVRAMERFQSTPEDILVLVDDVALPLGRLRIRKSGSDGGHNGLFSIIREIGSQQFPRLRMGVGPLPEQSNLVEFVLGTFRDNELSLVREMVERSMKAVEVIFTAGVERAMDVYNKAHT